MRVPPRAFRNAARAKRTLERPKPPKGIFAYPFEGRTLRTGRIVQSKELRRPPVLSTAICIERDSGQPPRFLNTPDSKQFRKERDNASRRTLA